MKKKDINGLNKIWTRNHAVVASKYEDQSQRMMLAYVSGFNIYKNKHSFSLSKNKMITWWNYEVYLPYKPSFPLFWRSWEIASSHKQAAVSLTTRCGHNEDKLNKSEYYIQNITFNNHQPQIIMLTLVVIT